MSVPLRESGCFRENDPSVSQDSIVATVRRRTQACVEKSAKPTSPRRKQGRIKWPMLAPRAGVAR